MSRPSLAPIPQSTSSRILHPVAPLHHLYPLFVQLSFHILPGKLDEEVGRLYEVVEELGGKSANLEDATYVVTSLRGRPRLLRALGSEWIDKKRMLSVEFIHDTFQTCLDHANADPTAVPRLPDLEQYLIHVGPASTKRLRSTSSDIDGVSSVSKRQRHTGQDAGEANTIDYLPDISLLPEDIPFEDIPRLCVERACPLVCVNQDIVNAIKPIYDEREFEEQQQKNSNVLSYRRSMSILKSAPRPIKSGKDARKLQDLGEKVANRIDEFLETGSIAESEEILASPRYAALREFASVYTIGKASAKDLYDRHHCRTLEDVRQHYQNISDESEEVRLKVKERRRREGGMPHVDIVEAWMKLKDELDSQIPREEVEEIANCVMEHLSAFIPGCQYTICGGYRRGKPQSNDVDIVFSPPNEDEDIGLLRNLYLRLSSLDIVTHVLHISNRSSIAPIKAAPNNFDNLDKAFVIFKLPGPGRKHRRVDLIGAPKERYAGAVLSWSGSMMFERDLRRYAENIGLKFRAGLIEVNSGREINLETEREIFQYLGLRYVPPELRNADG